MIKVVWGWYCGLTSRVKTSIGLSASIVGIISTVMSIAGLTLHDWNNNPLIDIGIALSSYAIIFVFIYLLIGHIFKDSVSIRIRQTPITISCGDIFATPGWRVIGCDTHFDTRVDDIVISKRSLHGRLVLEYGEKSEIEDTVRTAAQRLNLAADSTGLYDFPLGTIIRYDSKRDNHTYLLLSMTELDENHESHTNLAEFEQMLMTMWHEIDRVYAGNDIVLPLIGGGITRFDDGLKTDETLLKCILCTLNASGVSLNSQVMVTLSGSGTSIALYEYKDMFKSI